MEKETKPPTISERLQKVIESGDAFAGELAKILLELMAQPTLTQPPQQQPQQPTS